MANEEKRREPNATFGNGQWIDKSQLKLMRQQFKDACKYRGIPTWFYKAKNKHYNDYNEVLADYDFKKKVYAMYYDVTNHRQSTTHKFKWVNALDDEKTIVMEVPFDVEVTIGCVFQLPSGVSPEDHRTYRVAQIRNIPQHPISFMVACAPIFPTEVIQEPATTEAKEFHRQLKVGEDDN